MKLKLVTSIFILILLLSAAGCTGAASTGSPASTASAAGTASSFSASTPEPGMAMLSGVFLNSKTGKPYEGNLFLSRNLTADHPGYPPVISFSAQRDHRARQDEQGNFVFENVKPGKYVLVINTPVENYYIADKEKEGEPPLEIILTADQVTNMGTVYYP